MRLAGQRGTLSLFLAVILVGACRCEAPAGAPRPSASRASLPTLADDDPRLPLLGLWVLDVDAVQADLSSGAGQAETKRGLATILAMEPTFEFLSDGTIHTSAHHPTRPSDERSESGTYRVLSEKEGRLTLRIEGREGQTRNVEVYVEGDTMRVKNEGEPLTLPFVRR